VKHDFKVYLRLLSYLKPYWGVAILVVVGFAINAATEVSVAKLLEKIIEAIQHRDQGFTTLSAVAPLLGLLGTVLGIIESFLMIDIGNSSNPTLMIR
jgi:ATP-binding cassette, subfamily B, bacterial MsbA